MIEGKEEVGNVEEEEIVVGDQNPDQAGIINVQLPEPNEGVDEPQAPEVEQNPFLHALGINLIAEMIYKYLDIQSLTTCLYVHPSLNKDLRVIIAWRRHNHFTNFVNDENMEPLKDCFNSLAIPPRSRFTFENRNAFFSKHLDSEDLQEFFNRLGCNIRELSLKFAEDASYMFYRTNQDLRETTAMELIKKLITSQALFIQKLTLNVYCLIAWNKPHSAKPRPLGTNDQELDSINSEANASAKCQSLRKLEILGNISSKVMELVIRLSPNLQEIQVPELNYEYLVEPIYRLQLLKSITVYHLNIDTLERLLTINTGNLKLKQLKFDLWEPQVRNQEIERRKTLIVNALFETSWNTLEFLHWEGVARLQELIWPVCFSKVFHIKLGNPLDVSNLENPIFPQNFNFSQVFPAVKKFTLYHHANLNDQVNFVEFLNCLNLEPVATVTAVDVSSWQASDQRPIVDRLRAVFPNIKEIIFHR